MVSMCWPSSTIAIFHPGLKYELSDNLNASKSWYDTVKYLEYRGCRLRASSVVRAHISVDVKADGTGIDHTEIRDSEKASEPRLEREGRFKDTEQTTRVCASHEPDGQSVFRQIHVSHRRDLGE